MILTVFLPVKVNSVLPLFLPVETELIYSQHLLKTPCLHPEIRTMWFKSIIYNLEATSLVSKQMLLKKNVHAVR